MKKILFTFFALTFSIQLLVAQNLNQANSLFERRAYLNAAELYLIEEPKTQEIYEKLGDCYYFNSKMKQAEMYYEILIDKYEQNLAPTYLFRYSQALKGNENFSKADKWLKKYYEKKQIDSVNISETIAYFDSLNKQIKRPYILHKISANSTNSDFGTSYYRDSIVFASSRNSGEIYDWNNLPYLDLFKAEKTKSGDLINVSPFSNEINTKVHESNAIFTKDGKTMYFTRNNFKDGERGEDSKKISHLKIYKAELIEGKWSNITELPFNSKNYSVEHPTLSPDETELYFASDMPGSIGSFDLFVVSIHPNGSYGRPKNLGPKINTEQREQFPFISASNTLYFASDGHFGMGGLDIFKSEIINEEFSKPVNLSSVINSNLDDFAFLIDETNEIGYFSSNRAGGAGNDDIYRFTQLIIVHLTGIVNEKNSDVLLAGSKITLFDANNNVISNTIVKNDGTYEFELEANKTYKIKAEKDLYASNEFEITTDTAKSISKNIELELFENYVNKFEFDNDIIYFDLDSSYLREEGKEELRKVAKYMKDNPNIMINCSAHTDSRASDHYNMWLSERRANRTADYLISIGISSNNVKIQYFGETQLVNNCIDGVKCEESEHQLNRRAELTFSRIEI